MFSSESDSVEDAPLTKAERTKARIRDAALASFSERGFPDTTMRLIAGRAGVSVGSAYYYFPSKEHLVHELYVRVQQEHRSLAQPLLAQETSLVDRLRVVFETGLRAVAPYRAVAPGFLGAMIPPDSPINPLADASAESRALTVDLLREAVAGAEHRLPDDIADLLPTALFPAYLALVLRWTYDSTPDQQQTSRLLTTGLRMFAAAVPFLRVPGIRGVARDLLIQIAEVKA